MRTKGLLAVCKEVEKIPGVTQYSVERRLVLPGRCGEDYRCCAWIYHKDAGTIDSGASHANGRTEPEALQNCLNTLREQLKAKGQGG